MIQRKGSSMPNALSLFTKTEAGNFVPKIEKGTTMLVVGRHGSGKTCANFSFPGKTYVFDMDHRIKGGAQSLLWLGNDKLGEIDYDTYDVVKGFTAINNKMEELLNKAKTFNCPYKNVLFESIGALTKLLALDSKELRGVEKGKKRGALRFLSPDDYNYVSAAMSEIIFEFALPMSSYGINVIFSGWIVDKWGKPINAEGIPIAGTEYAPNVIVGEKLLATDKLAEEIPGYFNEVYYFRKEAGLGNKPKYTVEFNGTFARNTLGLPSGRFDITNKSFYQVWKEEIEKCSTSLTNKKL